MKYEKVITLVFWRRPQYAERVLQHLARCKGIQEYMLVIQLDGPPMTKMHHVCAKIDFANIDVKQLDQNMGCNYATRLALQRGFELSDYVIHVEEDVAMAPDSLQYFEWARQFGQDKSLMNIASLRHPEGWLKEHGPFPTGKEIEKKVKRQGTFSCWGWSTWKDRWVQMNQEWSTESDRALSWDVRLEQLRKRWRSSQLMPYVSRMINIGRHGGVHRGDYLLSYWAGSPEFVVPSEYVLVN